MKACALTRWLVAICICLLLGVGRLCAQPTMIEPDSVSASPHVEGDTIIAPPVLEGLTHTDSLQIDQSLRVAERVATPWQPKSGKALLWAIIPGGGQIYNRKYWKLPIVWGALATCVYFVGWNGRMYNEYHAAYRDIMSADPATNTAWLAFAPSGAKAEDYEKYSYLKSTLQRGNDYYRRYRDLSVVLTVAVYGLSLLDAYVDAELFTFDISPDLSMRITPSVALPTPQIPSYQMGVMCHLTF